MKGDLGATDGSDSAFAGVNLKSGAVLLDDDVNEQPPCVWLLLVVLLGLLVLALLWRRCRVPCCRSRRIRID